jgi:hypothetical protein
LLGDEEGAQHEEGNDKVEGTHQRKEGKRTACASPKRSANTTGRDLFLAERDLLPFGLPAPSVVRVDGEQGAEPRPATIQRTHVSKHEVLEASPIWSIFVCQVGISGVELLRISIPRTPVNSEEGMGCNSHALAAVATECSARSSSRTRWCVPPRYRRPGWA